MRRSFSFCLAMVLLGTAAAATATCPPVAPAAAGASNPHIRHVEQQILPAVVLPDTTAQTLAARMAELNVPGVSVAVIREGRIEWAHGWGVADNDRCTPVTTDTRFQAASISKPVFALAVMRLTETDVVDLDADIDHYLTRWHLPAAPQISSAPISLRHLLGHSAGLTLHGFPGYEADEALPSAIDVLNGEPIPRMYRPRVPAGMTHADALLRETPPGQAWKYSGGGYVLAQVAIEDVTHEPMAAMMARLVLNPLRMTSSSFAQPADAAMLAAAASGHSEGRVYPGRWHVYPQQAAAGLWTTPTDLARLLIDVRAADRGEAGHLLTPATARAMLTPGVGEWGIGFRVTGSAGGRRFEHGGANAGFRAWALMFTDSGDGVVVMTNADEGGALADDIMRAVANDYGWAGSDYGWTAMASRRLIDVGIGPERLAVLAGHYAATGLSTDLWVDGDHLMARTMGPLPERIIMTSPTRFITAVSGIEAEFVFDTHGAAQAIRILAGAPPITLTRSEGTTPQQAMATVPFFLRGSMNEWGTAAPMVASSPGAWSTDVVLPAGQHQLKLGSADWQGLDLGGDGRPVTPGVALPLLPGGSNLALTTDRAGRFRVSLSLDNNGRPTLMVVRIGD